MKKILLKIRLFFLPVAFIFVAASFSGAYFTDSVSTTNNSFTAATWSVTATATVSTSATATPEVVIINEVYSNPSTGEIEWIELMNKTSELVDLSTYTIEDGTAVLKNLSPKIIDANGYLVLQKGTDFTFGLNNDGDIIILKKSGIIQDQVSYGNWNDGNLADNAPAPGLGESTARIPNGDDTNRDNEDFEIRSHSFITAGGKNV